MRWLAAGVVLFLIGCADGDSSNDKLRNEAEHLCGRLYSDGTYSGITPQLIRDLEQRGLDCKEDEPVPGPYLAARLATVGHNAGQAGNHALMFRVLTALADSGDAGAEYDLGYIYAFGPQGIVRDLAKAETYYRRAAAHGDYTANEELKLYAAHGWPENFGQVVEWCKPLAEQHSPFGEHCVAVAFKMRGDLQTAFHWAQLSAKHGDDVGQLMVAHMFYDGSGVPKDVLLAEVWFNIAVSNMRAGYNRDEAAYYRDLIAQRDLTPVQRQQAQEIIESLLANGAGTSVRTENQGAAASPSSGGEAQAGSDRGAIGTGFVIDKEGHVITNSHVAHGCSKLTASINGATADAALIADDQRNDLALLKAPVTVDRTAAFRGQPIRAGDSVVVLGYPLYGLLAAQANVTEGTVSALAGLNNDSRQLQITAPVQPGNSGGPLVDRSGNIVGVVQAKLDAIKIASVTGDIPENINFAINVSVLRTFLDANNQHYDLEASAKELSVPDAADVARKFTVLVECTK